MKKAIAIIVFGLLWCNISFAGVIGKGPLKVTKQTAELLEDYFSGGKKGKFAKRKNESPWSPMFIVISSDGRHVQTFVLPNNYQGSFEQGNYIGQARIKCRKQSGKECFVFAKKRLIVWDNGSDKSKKRLKKEDIMAGKTLQILQELGFYDGGITQTKKTQQADESILSVENFPTNTTKSTLKGKTMSDLVYLNDKRRNRDVEEHWNKKYFQWGGKKAWAESQSGAWSWETSYVSEEDAIRNAVDSCNEYNYNKLPPCVVTYVSDKHLTYQEQADWMQKIYGKTTLAAKLIEKKKVKKKKLKIKAKKTSQTDDSKDIVQQIKDLKELYDSGALTKEEFTKAKKKLLN